MTTVHSYNKPLLCILALALIERLLIFNSGALSFPDEQRYISILAALHALLIWDVQGFIYNLIVDSGARPGTFLIELPALLAHYILAGGDLKSSVLPELILIPLLYNIFISLLLIVSLYQLARLLKLKQPLIVVIIWCALTSNLIWCKHLFFFDHALLLIVFASVVCLRSVSNLSLFAGGALIGLGFTVYPGFYPLCIASVIFILIHTYRSQKNFLSIALALGCLAPLTLFEVLARCSNISYINTLRELSKTINFGDFSENLKFVPLFLLESEGLSGLILLGALPIFLMRFKHLDRALKTYCLICFAACIAYALQGYLFSGMVFYGRLVRQFYPAMALALASVLEVVPLLSWAVCILLVALNINQLRAISLLSYPRSMLYRLGIVTDQRDSYITDFERDTCRRYFTILKPTSTAISTPQESQRVLVNFCDFFPISEKFRPYVAKTGQNLEYQAPHYLNLPVYLYEGLIPVERDIVRRWKPRVMIYTGKK